MVSKEVVVRHFFTNHNLPIGQVMSFSMPLRGTRRTLFIILLLKNDLNFD